MSIPEMVGVRAVIIRAEGTILRNNGNLAHGASDFLSGLSGLRLPLGILSLHPGTDDHETTFFRGSELHLKPELLRLFAKVVDRREDETPESLSRWYGGISKSMGFEPSHVAVIEANPLGVHAARDAGCRALALATRFKYSQLRHAHHTVGSFEHALGHLRTLEIAPAAS